METKQDPLTPELIKLGYDMQCEMITAMNKFKKAVSDGGFDVDTAIFLAQTNLGIFVRDEHDHLIKMSDNKRRSGKFVRAFFNALSSNPQKRIFT